MSVRFFLPDPRPLGDGADLRVVSGGRAAFGPGTAPDDLTLPEGFAPFVELRVHGAVATSPDAVRRVALPR